MSIYPSLEDLEVDHMAKAQLSLAQPVAQQPWPAIGGALYPTVEPVPYPLYPPTGAIAPPLYGVGLYPSLDDYMGLELSSDAVAHYVPERALIPQPTMSMQTTSPSPYGGIVAPLSGQSLGLQRAQVTHGIRQLTLCKDGKGRVGLRVGAINKGVFVSLVQKDSPAALAGLRFGDQILQINGTLVAGFSMDQVHTLFKKAPANGITVVVRDRPFERTVTLQKDSVGHIGFHFKDGAVTGLVKDSSAARNGLLTEHHLLEVEGQNVVGLKDKEIRRLIEEAPPTITVTIIPSFVYQHIMSKMSNNLVKSFMDHSVANM